MGKSKKRNFNKNSTSKGLVFKRCEVIKSVILDIHNNTIDDQTRLHISLFGITAEELVESGADIEEIELVKHLLI